MQLFGSLSVHLRLYEWSHVFPAIGGDAFFLTVDGAHVASTCEKDAGEVAVVGRGSVLPVEAVEVVVSGQWDQMNGQKDWMQRDVAVELVSQSSLCRSRA